MECRRKSVALAAGLTSAEDKLKRLNSTVGNGLTKLDDLLKDWFATLRGTLTSNSVCKSYWKNSELSQMSARMLSSALDFARRPTEGLNPA